MVFVLRLPLLVVLVPLRALAVLLTASRTRGRLTMSGGIWGGESTVEEEALAGAAIANVLGRFCVLGRSGLLDGAPVSHVVAVPSPVGGPAEAAKALVGGRKPYRWWMGQSVCWRERGVGETVVGVVGEGARL